MFSQFEWENKAVLTSLPRGSHVKNNGAENANEPNYFLMSRGYSSESRVCVEGCL